MSAITSDWASVVAEAAHSLPVQSFKVSRREQEFGAALTSYTTRYIAEQERHRPTSVAARRRPGQKPTP
jgi:hypothetical protein